MHEDILDLKMSEEDAVVARKPNLQRRQEEGERLIIR